MNDKNTVTGDSGKFLFPCHDIGVHGAEPLFLQ
jgi:hypothetical protein